MSVFHNLLMAAATDAGGTGTGNYSLWAWGGNDIGQLADGTQTSRSSPVQVGTLTDWTPNIAANWDSVHAIKKDGTLWAWGFNYYGNLGLGDNDGRNSPVQVGTASDWYYVGKGTDTTYAINTSGELYSCGNNSVGQLGHDDTTDRSTLAQVGSLTNWAACAGGYKFATAVKTDGTSWSLGRGEFGVYFRDSETVYSSPVQSGSDTDRWGASSYPPSGGWENGIEMQKVFACGYYHTSLIKSDGTLWGGGLNTSGELGFAGEGSSPSQVGSESDWEGIAAGAMWGLGINDGEGLTWGGDNSYGNLGNGTTSVVIGTHYSWGSTVSRVGANLNSSAQSTALGAMIIGGELWVAGNNYQGMLGTGDHPSVTYSSPVQVGSDDNWVNVIPTGFATLGVKEE